MDKSGIIGEISENLGGVVKQAAKQVAKTPVDLTKAAVDQVKGDAGVPEGLGQAVQQATKAVQTPKQTPQDRMQQEIQDKQDLAKARSQLHSMYYQKLITPQKQEERVAEKLEREDKQKEFEDIQAKSKKPQALPDNVKQGTGEKVVGISG